jgi:hypothetical protein
MHKLVVGEAPPEDYTGFCTSPIVFSGDRGAYFFCYKGRLAAAGGYGSYARWPIDLIDRDLCHQWWGRAGTFTLPSGMECVDKIRKAYANDLDVQAAVAALLLGS